MRVLIAPKNISTQAEIWKTELLNLNIETEIWIIGNHVPNIDINYIDRYIDRDKYITNSNYRWAILKDAIDLFDVFHFQYGETLLYLNDFDIPIFWDLPLLRSLNKTIIMHYHGSDVRIPSKHIEIYKDNSCYYNTPIDKIEEDVMQSKIDVHRLYSHKIFISTPDLKCFIPEGIHIKQLFYRNYRTDDTNISSIVDKKINCINYIPKILFAPTNIKLKGGIRTLNILKELDSKGIIKLTYLSKTKSHKEFIKILASHDLVLDSLSLGYHGILSLEALSLGTIPICFIKDDLYKDSIPIINTTVDKLYDTLSELSSNLELRKEYIYIGLEWIDKYESNKSIVLNMVSHYKSSSLNIIENKKRNYYRWPYINTSNETFKRINALSLENKYLKDKLKFYETGIDYGIHTNTYELIKNNQFLYKLVRRLKEFKFNKFIKR